MARTLLLNLKKSDFEFFFGNKILTSEDLSFNTNETSAKEMFSHFSPSIIIDRLKKVGANRSLLKKIGTLAVRVGKLRLITSRMTEVYSRADVLRWAKKYEQLFADTTL